jgi:hypothetical protein
MQYMLLIHDVEADWADRSEDEQHAVMREYLDFTDELRETITTDGPFAETKEQLGGYYLIDVETPDEAIEWAAKIPSARFGKVEVRPIVMREAEVQT